MISQDLLEIFNHFAQKEWARAQTERKNGATQTERLKRNDSNGTKQMEKKLTYLKKFSMP